MANTFKVMYRGYAPTTETTLYTAPVNTTAIVNSIVVANVTASAMTYNIKFDSIPMAASVNIPAKDSLTLDIKQVLEQGDTISGFCTSASALAFHISGLEMT